MNQAVMEKYRDLFRKDLFEKVLPFWVDHGLDKEHGGIDTCLDLSGKVYSAEKSVWMQGRGGWLFSYVCNMFGIDESYRQMAQSAIAFTKEHCIDPCLLYTSRCV